MTIEIKKPELEQLVHEEILRGHFNSFDELLSEALTELRDIARPPQTQRSPRKVRI